MSLEMYEVILQSYKTGKKISYLRIPMHTPTDYQPEETEAFFNHLTKKLPAAAPDRSKVNDRAQSQKA